MAIFGVVETAARSPYASLYAITLVFIVFILYLLAVAIYNIHFHPLAKFPGPKLRAVWNWPYALAMVRGTSPQDMLELHNQYGPVVRVAPGELTFIRPAAFSEIYGQKKRGQPELVKDKKYYSGMGEPTLLHSDQIYHAYLRKMLAPGFSDAALQKQETVIQEYIGILMRKLQEKSQSGEATVDLEEWYRFFVFDVIAYLTYGESFDCLTTSNLHVWPSLLPKLARFMAFAQAAERLPKFLKFPILALCMNRQLLVDSKTANQISQAKVDHRLNLTTTMPDFMGKLIDAYKDGKMTMHQLNSNASFLMAAGSETLATLLANATFQLISNPRTLKELNQEIRGKFASADEITMITVNQCKYLLGCLDETLRIQAPSPATHPRYTPPEGVVIDGYYVPGNVAVGIPIYAACRSSLNFSDPDKFVPERWTGQDPSYHGDCKEAAQVFSVGPRDCLGRNLAYLEMKLVMAKLVWHFDLVRRFPEDWADQKVYMVWEKPPLMVMLKPVDRASALQQA